MKHLIKDGQIVMSGIPGHFTRDNGETFWGGYDKRVDLHYADGWRDEEKPEIDYSLEQYGKPYYDMAADKVKYPVEAKDLPSLEEMKARHYADLEITTDEISGIISKLKNIYDPMRTNPENVPADLVILVGQMLPLRNQAKAEIEALATQEEAFQYVIKGVVVTDYINQLKAFL